MLHEYSGGSSLDGFAYLIFILMLVAFISLRVVLANTSRND